MRSNIYIQLLSELNTTYGLIVIVYLCGTLQRVPTFAHYFHIAIALCMAIIVPKQGCVGQVSVTSDVLPLCVA